MEETFLFRVIIFYVEDNSEDVLTCFTYTVLHENSWCFK